MQQRHEDEICENELVFEELQVKQPVSLLPYIYKHACKAYAGFYTHKLLVALWFPLYCVLRPMANGGWLYTRYVMLCPIYGIMLMHFLLLSWPQAEIQQQENLNEALDKDLEKEKQKAIKLNGDLSMTNKAIEVFNDNIREQESMVSQTEKTLLEFQTGMNIVTNRLFSYEKQLEILLQQVEGFFHNIR